MRTVTALILTATLAVPAFAQQPPRRGGGAGGMFGGGGPAGLLRSEDVQKELKLTDEQKTKLKEFNDKQAAARREAFGGGGGGGGFDREKMQEFARKSQEETTKFLKDTLTEDQNKRLKQIGLQQSMKTSPAGALFTISFSQDGISLGEPTETGKALKVTDEQKDKIKSINEQSMKDIRELFTPGERPSADAQKKMENLRKEAAEKVMEVLTEEQRKTLKELQGEEFKGKIETGPPGGRRPGGAGGAGGGPGGAGGAGGRGAGRRGGGGGDNPTPPKKDGDKKDGI